MKARTRPAVRLVEPGETLNVFLVFMCTFSYCHKITAQLTLHLIESHCFLKQQSIQKLFINYNEYREAKPQLAREKLERY